MHKTEHLYFYIYFLMHRFLLTLRNQACSIGIVLIRLLSPARVCHTVDFPLLWHLWCAPESLAEPLVHGATATHTPSLLTTTILQQWSGTGKKHWPLNTQYRLLFLSINWIKKCAPPSTVVLKSHYCLQSASPFTVTSSLQINPL